MQISIANYFELGAAIVCTICLTYKPAVMNRWFVGFLWLTVLVELSGKLLVGSPAKVPMYNIFNGVEFIFYSLLLAAIVQPFRFKQFTWLTGILFFLFFITNLLLRQGIRIYNTHTHTVGAICIIVLALLFFIQSAIAEQEIFVINRAAVFFLLSGLLLFYAGNLINTSLLNYLAKSDQQKAIKLYRLINHNLNAILYGCISIALVLEVRTNKPVAAAAYV